MFIREKKNKSGSTSVQIISKHSGKYRVEKTIGSSSSPQGISILLHQAQHELLLLQKQTTLFISQQDADIHGFLNTLTNADVNVAGPELVFGKLWLVPPENFPQSMLPYPFLQQVWQQQYFFLLEFRQKVIIEK